MRVAHFNTFAEGGSAVLMVRLHRALLDAGVESRIYHRRGEFAEDEGRKLEFIRGIPSRLVERLKERLESKMLADRRNYFGTLWSPVETCSPAEDGAPDLVHLHLLSH